MNIMTPYIFWSTFVSCSSAVKEGSCSGEDLQQLQNDCLSYGMEFSGNTGASDLTDCSLGAEQGATSVSASGDCKIQGEGECTVTCTFPPNDETNTDTNTNPESTDQDNDGFTIENGDCDDNNPNIHPEAAETPANGVDEDCDAQELCYLDEDGDGFGSEQTVLSPDFSCTTPGVSAVDTDCFDLTNGGATIYPGAAELDSAAACMQDEDEDGYGSRTPPQGVTVGTDCDDHEVILNPNDLDMDGFSSCDGDCDDTNGGVNPAVVDTPEDGIDQDCNGLDATCFLTGCDLSINFGNGKGVDFVLIDVSAGDPLGRYTLSNNFYMMTTEVTQGQFAVLQSYYDVTVDSTCYGVGENYPAYYANWHEFAAYANALSTMVGLTECYSCSGSGRNVSCSEHSSYSGQDVYNCPGYRLPTEAEWELAARSGTTSEFWTGEGVFLGGNYSSLGCNNNVTIEDGVYNPLLGNYAWFCGNTEIGQCTGEKTSQEVSQLLPNGNGLYDIHGNIREWVHDWNDNNWPSQAIDSIGVPDATNLSRVLRGGNWINSAGNLQVSFRSSGAPEARRHYFGARLVKGVY